ncbi:MAG: hypothetical protein KC543_05565, partial [Myxococcales bacterium]|nr:hypothetical protein [Myxococcales bacterium]
PDPFAGDPVAALGGLEARLLAADHVTITAQVSASGAARAELDGTIEIARATGASIALEGTFDGTAIATRWDSTAAAAVDTGPPVWADGLVIGVTRMGVLHNWANVIGGADPDTGNGDIRDWVGTDEPTWLHDDPASRTLAFHVVFGGAPIGEVELTLDDRGLPARRVQVVHFPEGDMRVLEEYVRFDVRP